MLREDKVFRLSVNEFDSVHHFQPRLAQPVQQHLDMLVPEDHPLDQTAAAR